MIKLMIVLSSVLLSFAGYAYESAHYECHGYAMCQCIPSGTPGSGMTCDYNGSGTGSDKAAAISAAKSDAKNNCEQDCTRKTGNRCYNISAGNCELVKE